MNRILTLTVVVLLFWEEMSI